jgi:hypothetical protein
VPIFGCGSSDRQRGEHTVERRSAVPTGGTIRTNPGRNVSKAGTRHQCFAVAPVEQSVQYPQFGRQGDRARFRPPATSSAQRFKLENPVIRVSITLAASLSAIPTDPSPVRAITLTDCLVKNTPFFRAESSGRGAHAAQTNGLWELHGTWDESGRRWNHSIISGNAECRTVTDGQRSPLDPSLLRR